MCKVDDHQRLQTPVMMFDSPHTSAPMLMRGNALVLKTPVENAPRTSIEKHLSWSSRRHPSRSAISTPPIASSRISAQTTTRHRLCGELGGRGTTTSRTTTQFILTAFVFPCFTQVSFYLFVVEDHVLRHPALHVLLSGTCVYISSFPPTSRSGNVFAT